MKVVDKKDSETLTVDVPIIWDGGICYPVLESDIIESATFKKWTFGDNVLVEKFCWREDEVKEKNQLKMQKNIDYIEMRRMSLRRCLLDWTLDIPIEREDGWITNDSYERIGKIGAPLLGAFVSGFWNHIELSQKEREEIDKQATILFSPNSHGVMQPCEAVRLYCTLSGFAEKFNMTLDDMSNLPFREYLMLKTMFDNDNESQRRQQSQRAAPPIKVAGPGGTRISRGKKVKM